MNRQPMIVGAGGERVGTGPQEESRRCAEPLDVPVYVCRGELFDAGHHQVVAVVVRPRQACAQENNLATLQIMS